MVFLNLLFSIRIGGSYYNIKGGYFDLLQRIIIIGNLLNYGLLEGRFIKAANKVICKALRDLIFFTKYFKNCCFLFFIKFNYTIFIVAVAFPFFCKVLGYRKSGKGDIKSVTRLSMLMVILTFLV